jgi:3-phosphoshikimate 1-carboxyvinyltransferase
MLVKPIKCLKGEIFLPGDKSVSHRAIIFAALSDGMCRISNLGMGKDNRSTIGIFRQLGVRIDRSGDNCKVNGVGLKGLKEPQNILNAGNSGTTMRIISGILSAQPFFSVIGGDKYLVERPMRRVIEPLTKMGARIFGRKNNALPPLAVIGNESLKGIEYPMNIASAQVKSALIMAGLYAAGETRIIEPVTSRNHTECLMKYLKLPVNTKGLSVSVSRIQKIPSFDIEICGDISSAAFFMVSAALIKGSKLLLKNICLNRTRTGVIDVLRKMGADISIISESSRYGELTGDVLIKGTGKLRGTVIKGSIIPRLIDEIPVIAVAAAFADGVTVIDDAEELRVKESDRIKAVVTGLKRLNIQAEENQKGMTIKGGGKVNYAEIQTYGDHRIAMAFYVFGICSEKGLKLDDAASISISFPDFFTRMREVAYD